MKLFPGKNKSGKCILFVLLLFGTKSFLPAQENENLQHIQPLTLGGYFSTSLVFTQQPADSTNLHDSNGYYTGSLNFTFFGIRATFTFIYSNQEGEFSYPFNQFGLHPSYKWLKTHMGFTFMNLYPYTMNHHLFFVKPGAVNENNKPDV
jgi:hypothetical protein